MNEGVFVIDNKIIEAKGALDALINKQRAYLYKPIQIAEILYHVRLGDLSIGEVAKSLETYRNKSKRWRDEVTRLLLNQVSTSSQKYQDNLFGSNAVPPAIIGILADYNNEHDGIVERYIYQQFGKKQGLIMTLMSVLDDTMPADFNLESFLSMFVTEKGLRRSIDKAYEAVVYALFNTLVRALKINVTVHMMKPKQIF